MATRCMNCQDNLEIQGRVQCDRCAKNQVKYGFPTTCTYCKLPAAFMGDRCVWCCYSERKSGAPVPCVKCKQKAAFVTNPKRTDFLCRLCKITGRAAGFRELCGVTIAKEGKRDPNTKIRELEKAAERKRAATQPLSEMDKFELKIPRFNFEDQNKIIMLEQKIENLEGIIKQNEKMLIDKNTRIAVLVAELDEETNFWNRQVEEMQKNHARAIERIEDNYRDQLRQDLLKRDQAAKREAEKKELERQSAIAQQKKVAEERSKKELEDRKRIERELAVAQRLRMESERKAAALRGDTAVQPSKEEPAAKEGAAQAKKTAAKRRSPHSPTSPPNVPLMERDEADDSD